MRYFRNIIYSILLFAFLLASCSREITPIPEGLIEIEISSQETNDTYLVRIRLPKEYYTSSLSYPVLYQLDGHTTTGSVVDDYEKLLENEQVREIIIVSVDYVNENQRVRDFTPTFSSNFDGSGEAQSFLGFLRFELVPMIDQQFRTDALFGNTLRGHSLGGLFGSYAMFRSDEAENVYSNFIIESPSWWWDDNYIIGLESEFASRNSDLPVRSYFAVGELEAASMKASFDEVRKRLLQRNYPSFEQDFQVLPSELHLDVRENDIGLLRIFAK